MMLVGASVYQLLGREAGHRIFFSRENLDVIDKHGGGGVLGRNSQYLA